MAVVIDVEFLYEAPNAPVVKEAAICALDGREVLSAIFLPPYAWLRLPSATRRNNAWIYKHLNGFRWCDGEMPYCELKQFLKNQITNSHNVYAKGLQKCKFLSSLLDIPVHNLEDLGCPRVKELITHPTHCPVSDVFPTHNAQSSCALRKCIAFSNWLEKNSFDE